MRHAPHADCSVLPQPPVVPCGLALHVRKLVLVGSKRGSHLRHIGIALLPHLSHHLGLVQQRNTLVALFCGLVDGALAIHKVHICLVHLQCHVVLFCLHGAASHGNIGLSHAQLVVALQSVEDVERCLQPITIIQCAYICVCIGLRVDGSSKVELSRHRPIYAWQEGSKGLCLCRPAVVQCVPLLSHRMAVVGCILHTAVHRPGLGSIQLCAEHQGRYGYNHSLHLIVVLF